jgi:hypothetical protein
MNKIINKNTVLFCGIVAVAAVIAVLAITIYFGMRAGGSITEVIAVVFLKTKIQMGFFVANIILIVLFCFKISSEKLLKQFFVPALIVAAAMLMMNLTLVYKNFLAIIVSLFWTFTLIHLYQVKRELLKTN